MGGGIRSRTLFALASIAVLLGTTASFLQGSQEPVRDEGLGAAPSFQIEVLFSSSLYDSPGFTLSRDLGPVFDMDELAVLVISSTGDSRYEYWDNHSHPQGHGYYSCQLSAAAVQYAHGALDQERFSTLADRYNDFKSAGKAGNPLTRLTVSDTQGTKTVDFWGMSAVGIIPLSYSSLMNLLSATMMNISDPLDASIHINAQNTSSPGITLNVSITNNEDFPLYGRWSDGGGYRMYIVSQTGSSVDLVHFDVTMAFINYTIPAHEMYYMGLRSFEWDALPECVLTIMVEVSLNANQVPIAGWPMELELGFTKLSFEQGINYTPSLPFAWIQSNSSSTGSGTTVRVDASTSADMVDNQSALEVRWDWNGDLVWDTDWTTSKVASHLFTHSGNYTMRLEVKNSMGLTSEDSFVVSVVGKESESLVWLGAAAIAIAIGVVLMGYFILRARKSAK